MCTLQKSDIPTSVYAEPSGTEHREGESQPRMSHLRKLKLNSAHRKGTIRYKNHACEAHRIRSSIHLIWIPTFYIVQSVAVLQGYQAGFT
jgi:hypothetical protein